MRTHSKLNRIFSLLLAMIMVLGLVACGGSSAPAPTEAPKADAPAAPAATEAPKEEAKPAPAKEEAKPAPAKEEAKPAPVKEEVKAEEMPAEEEKEEAKKSLGDSILFKLGVGKGEKKDSHENLEFGQKTDN